jgi:hypothetical protein
MVVEANKTCLGVKRKDEIWEKKEKYFFEVFDSVENNY